LCPQHCGGYLQLLNTSVAGLYNGTFINASADIYIAYGTTRLGESETYLNEFSFSMAAMCRVWDTIKPRGPEVSKASKQKRTRK